MRRSYGTAWWGQQWLNALKDIDFSNRLPRGRTYANKGAVKEINITANHIHAKVAGSRPRPYTVDITIPQFNAPTSPSSATCPIRSKRTSTASSPKSRRHSTRTWSIIP